ncbi:MAG: thioredoxin-dependent thiol peroxidase [Planctomycetota bacterium]
MPIPETGKKAPDFELPASTGESLKLSKLAKAGPVVLYFYPKADTPGCTTQACGIRDQHADFEKLDATVIGVSPDPINKVNKFAEKRELNFPLLADEDHAVCEKYGVWVEKSMYGKKYMGTARTTFVIAKGGKIAAVFEKVKPKEHADQVLAALADL